MTDGPVCRRVAPAPPSWAAARSTPSPLIARLDGVNLLPAARVYILGTTNSWTTYV